MMVWQPKTRQIRVIKTVLFVLCLAPFVRLFWLGLADGLGTNPVETVTRATGWWILFFLCATLAVTPLRRITGTSWLLRLRRMLGLFVFFYATLHFMTYVWLDVWFDVGEVAKDIVKRPFITVGFTAFILLIPLAATSTDAMVRRLGRHWLRLHRAVYAIAVLGVLHYWWLVKRDITEPLIYALVLGLLLAARVVWSRRSLLPTVPHTTTTQGVNSASK